MTATMTDTAAVAAIGAPTWPPANRSCCSARLTEREEKASVALASNLPFSEWGKVIPKPRLVAAVIDRVTFNAHIIETGTESYRLRTTKARAHRKTA
jgi:DNA replication protein DnaC